MPRQEVTIYDTLCRSPGECLLRLGRMARFLSRHGSAPEQIAGELGVGRHVCSLAVTFALAPDLLKLRALVEGWSMLTIRSELRAMHVGV